MAKLSSGAPKNLQFATNLPYKLQTKLVQAQEALESHLGIGINRVAQQAMSAALSDNFDGADGAGPAANVGTANILGTSIAEKISKDSLTGEPCIRVYVEKKIADHDAIEPESFIPKQIPGLEDVSTDIIETGPIRQLALYDGHYPRPVPCGIGIAAATNGQRMVGTLGARCVVDGYWAILSNNHVLALNDKLPIGTKIVQPGLGAVPTNVVGKLHKKIELSPFSANVADVAVATSGNQYVSGDHKSYKMVPNPIAAYLGQAVRKDGYMTGSTVGQVTALNVQINVESPDGRKFFFINQIQIQGILTDPSKPYFSNQGDSGALVVDEPGHRPVALLFAGNGPITFATPIKNFQSTLGISFQ